MLIVEERSRDAAGRPRSPATMPGYHAGRPPRSKGMRCPPTPHESRRSSPSCARRGRVHGARVRALIVVPWRAGLRISEALALAERDLEPARGALLVRHGKGGKRREAGMDDWGWEQLRPWLDYRSTMPIGTLLCVINGPTCGRPWSGPAARSQLRRLASDAGVRRRFAPHQLRHAHAVEMAREGLPLNVIQRQLGHADLGVTSVYLQGIDNTEVISARAIATRAGDAGERWSAHVVGCSSSREGAPEKEPAPLLLLGA